MRSWERGSIYCRDKGVKAFFLLKSNPNLSKGPVGTRLDKRSFDVSRVYTAEIGCFIGMLGGFRISVICPRNLTGMLECTQRL